MAEDLNLVVTEERVRDMDLETFYNLEGNAKIFAKIAKGLQLVLAGVG